MTVWTFFICLANRRACWPTAGVAARYPARSAETYSSSASQDISGRSLAPTCSICSLRSASRRLRKLGLPASNSSISSRANEQTREEMRRILGEIQDGSFARELVEEFDAGKPNFLKRREAERSEQIEQVGARLRPLMSWLAEDE